MKRPYTLHPIPIKTENSLDTLVENRSAYTLNKCELNLYETHQQASNINLVFDDFALTSMLRGKKVMRVSDREGFDYLPGESVIVPPRERLSIDFPEANLSNPTQCLALLISGDQIKSILNELNEFYPKFDNEHKWDIDRTMLHMVNNQDLADSIDRFIRISTDSSPEKDLLADIALRELLIRLMQTQARQLFEQNYKQLASSHRFAHVIQYIKENIQTRINPDHLSEQACMSRANFFKKFKEEFGMSPGEYILTERLRLAKVLLSQPHNPVTQVCYMSGFQNLNYFIRTFKRETGITPKTYQQWVADEGAE
jgi:AraC-like DNA-binding protein